MAGLLDPEKEVFALAAGRVSRELLDDEVLGDGLHPAARAR
jgi:hypothetical protein